MRCGCITAGAVAWLVLALLFVALSARGGDSGVNQSDALRGNVGMWAAGAYALIVTAWVGWITHPPAWLAGLARALGRLSYGVYLFHNLMPELFKPMRAGLGGVAFAALCLAATLVVSALLNWSWERPWREWGRSLAARMSAARVNATSHAH